MQITKINIEKDDAVGLESINMSRLGQVVIVAGKNGAGKSRLLEKVRVTLSQKPSEQELTGAIEQKENAQRNILYHKGQISHLENQKNANSDLLAKDSFDRQILAQKLQIQNCENRIQTAESVLNWHQIETSNPGNNTCIHFVPKTLDLRGCNHFSKNDLIRNADAMKHLGIDNAPSSTLAKIQRVHDQWFIADHQNSIIPKQEKDQIIQSYNTLKKYLKIFLNTDLSYDSDGNATIFSFKLGDAKLSDGQKVLLQLCLAIYSQASQLSELIVMLDEPENHLHPQALIEVVDKLIDAIPNGQIWIATHSVNLLAHFEPSSIWYMENGKISYSGNLPKRVLDGLIGDDDEQSKLQDFLTLPAQMASSKFAVECLFEPQTLETGADDPQTNQIIQAIKHKKEKGQKIKVLDFGAGKGRLLSTINELEFGEQIPVANWLDYYAFDLPSADNEKVCKQVISDVYGTEENRYFSDDKQLLESVTENSFDLVIMCNVFHEIDPKDWFDLFNKNNPIVCLLGGSGTLLVVEDQLIPVGEKAYQNGFLVFDKLQFTKLFDIDDYHVLDARNDGRLRAHFIPAAHLNKISKDSRIAAIENLNHTAKKEVKKLRSNEPSYKNGKLHGFWVQQVANSQLAIDEFDNH